MGHRVTLKPSAHSFEVPEGQSILQAGLDAGFMMPYSCRTGVCRTCRGTLLEGRVDYGAVHPTYLPDTDQVFSTLKVRDLLRFEGPLGTFFLREESDKPIVMVASGTGFAPIKAMCESALQRGLKREMTLYWGCRAKRDLYMLDVPQAWK